MTYTTMIYKAPSGQWSWSVLDDDRTPIAGGAGYASEAEAEADADEELATYLDPNAGLRADGEPLCGIDSIDYPPDTAHPGNANPSGSC
jgi:hypothetical protein